MPTVPAGESSIAGRATAVYWLAWAAGIEVAGIAACRGQVVLEEGVGPKMPIWRVLHLPRLGTASQIYEDDDDAVAVS